MKRITPQAELIAVAKLQLRFLHVKILLVGLALSIAGLI